MNNNHNQIQKTPPSKQGKETLKILLGNNPHLKADRSTTTPEKNPLKPPPPPKNGIINTDNHPNKIQTTPSPNQRKDTLKF